MVCWQLQQAGLALQHQLLHLGGVAMLLQLQQVELLLKMTQTQSALT
jgi:hypothetical protein